MRYEGFVLSKTSENTGSNLAIAELTNIHIKRVVIDAVDEEL